jgi:hypothetical protein
MSPLRPQVHLGCLLALAVLCSACNPNVKWVEINGIDCRVNTAEIGAEPCCESKRGWVRLEMTGAAYEASGATCDPSNP